MRFTIAYRLTVAAAAVVRAIVPQRHRERVRSRLMVDGPMAGRVRIAAHRIGWEIGDHI